MGSEIICEVYRFNTNCQKFDAVCTITYFGDQYFVQGMQGNIGREQLRELIQHLLNKSVKTLTYKRLKGDKFITKTINLGDYSDVIQTRIPTDG